MRTALKIMAMALAGALAAAATPAALAAKDTQVAQADDAAANPPSAGAVPGETPAVDLLGFRSAHFGMDEKEVRAAIASDFGKEAAAKATEQENLAEKTKVISLTIPDLFEGAGVGSVSYVFGYKSKKLIQVALLWSKQTDPELTPERLFSGANVLQGYFSAQGYVPATVVNNAMIDAGILMFRGADKDENTAMLLLQGSFAGEGEQRKLEPNALLLYYIDNAKDPDVFRIPPGQF